MVAAQCINAIQTIASRNTDPVDQLVVSVTSIESSSNAYNVIARHVDLKGTIRSMSTDVMRSSKQRLQEICQGTCTAFGATADVRFHGGYPCMVNHIDQTDFAAEVARQISGDCAEAEMTMTGEDFAYMLEERPGAYILMGNGDSASLHHPEYDFNDDAIPAGCSWWAEIVEQCMPVS